MSGLARTKAAARAGKKAAVKPDMKPVGGGVKASSRARFRLRVAQVWHDEVMADRVYWVPTKVTLGTTKDCTFTIADVGLPERFSFLEPGKSVYMLTLGADMGGRICLAGDEMDVAEFLDKQGGGVTSGDVHTTPIRPGDWGVIELDSSGEQNVFFQFVAEEPPLQPPRWRDAELLLPAIAFSLILHTVILAVLYPHQEEGNSLVFPGRRSLMTRYLVRRPPVPVKTPGQSASKDGDKEDVKSATRDKKGKAGGETSEKPLATNPDAPDLAPEAPKVALLDKKATRTFDRIIGHRAMDDKVTRMLNRMGPSTTGTFTQGGATGFGIGDARNGTGATRGSERAGPGGGGSADKLFVSQGKIDTGQTRAPRGNGNNRGTKRKEVAVVKPGTATGDFGGLTKAEIDRVIKARKGFIRACYQNELNRVRGLGGKVVVNFRIRASGKVQSVRVVGGKSSLRNPRVESCIKRQIARLKFPAKDSGAVVDYPFIFSQG